MALTLAHYESEEGDNVAILEVGEGDRSPGGSRMLSEGSGFREGRDVSSAIEFLASFTLFLNFSFSNIHMEHLFYFLPFLSFQAHTSRKQRGDSYIQRY